jgi:hypothetical protein
VSAARRVAADVRGGPPAARMSPYTRRLLIYLLIAILIGCLVYAFLLANRLNESTFSLLRAHLRVVRMTADVPRYVKIPQPVRSITVLRSCVLLTPRKYQPGAGP